MTEIEITKELAEQEFVRFADAAKINLMRSRIDAEQEELDKNTEFFIEEVMSGKITVNDAGFPTIVIDDHKSLETVSFARRPRGVDRLAMDRCKQGAAQLQKYSWVGSVVGVPAKLLAQLDDVDFNRVWVVFQLFLADGNS